MATTHREHEIDLEEGRRCLIHVPAGGNGNTPVLCFLHGHGESAEGSATKGWKVKLHGSPPGLAFSPVLPAWCPAKERLSQFLVVSPQRAQPGPWTNQDAGWVWAAVQNAASRHGGGGRLFLTGFSYGAGGVLKFATAQNGERWSALWLVDPSPSDAPLPATRTRVLLHHGGYFSADAPSRDSTTNTRKAPIEDWKRRTNPAWTDVDALRSRATSAQPWWSAPAADRAVRAFDNLEHAATCIAAYSDPDAYDWLLGSR